MERFEKLNKHIDKEIEWLKPPMGLRPKWVHDITRFVSILEAIQRYDECDKEVPIEWIEEAQAIYDAHPKYITEVPINERARIGRVY